MGKKSQDYLHQAVKNIAQAQAEFQKETNARFERNEKITESLSREIAELQKEVKEMRNTAIRAQAKSGVPKKDIALEFGLSAARISQITTFNH
ncbi:hypothetical protein ACLSYX_11705 [[Pasteurella] aerogenes]|uniref:hypothetical protein n=1 Tax=Actinobacillus pleuropneumoniae TaxID=715 RepID=UPI003CFD3431